MNNPSKNNIKLLYGAASAFLLTSCGQPEPVPGESVAWIDNYYIQHPVSSLSASAGGWLFRGARDQAGELRIGFLVPGPLNPDPDKRKAIMGTLCPAKSEAIWQFLPSRNKLVINVWTQDNKFKDSATC